MDQNTILQNLQSLPPEAQKQVADFIAFLQTRYRATLVKRKMKPALNLTDEAFMGIWRDREEMLDSTEWVKKARSRDWEQGA